MLLSGKGLDCWTFAHTYLTRPNKTIAEIQLTGGEYAVHPLKRLSKTEARDVAAAIGFLQWLSIGDPPRRSIEARLERIEAEIDKCAGYFEDRGEFPEYVEKLDAAAERLAELRDTLRFLRAA